MKDIYARVPVDRSAAKAVAGGVEFVCPKKIQTADSDVPLQVRSGVIPVDLTGVRVGRFVVAGLSASVPKRWVVRCDCGIYSLRTAKAIRNPRNADDRCERCRYLAFLRRRDRWIRGVPEDRG